MEALGHCDDTDIQAILGKCAAIVIKFSSKTCKHFGLTESVVCILFGIESNVERKLVWCNCCLSL